MIIPYVLFSLPPTVIHHKRTPTGASTNDEALAYKLGIPGVVYDYYAELVTLFFPYDEFKYEPCPYIFGPRKRDPHIY